MSLSVGVVEVCSFDSVCEECVLSAVALAKAEL
jgi:hypothetical protein